jgi:alpha-1,3-rhamnosyltransferase
MLETLSPLVSVIVPAYNHEKYVMESISSVLNQTYSNIQLIVVDDGSKDDTPKIIETLNAKQQFIFEQQENMGLSKTLNKAITKYATGKYIALLASDDFWHPNKLSLQVNAMEANADWGMVCSKALIVNEASKIVDRFSEILFTRNFGFAEIALGKALVLAPTTLIRKSVFESIGLFDEKLIIEDLDMWLRIASKFNIGFANEELAFYRNHTANTSKRVIEMNKARFEILVKWKGIDSALFAKISRNFELIALQELGRTDPKEALKYFKPTLQKFFNVKYRRFMLNWFFKGKF